MPIVLSTQLFSYVTNSSESIVSVIGFRGTNYRCQSHSEPVPEQAQTVA